MIAFSATVEVVAGLAETQMPRFIGRLVLAAGRPIGSAVDRGPCIIPVM
jgi:hypothetical protein